MSKPRGINGSLVFENEDVELVPSFVHRGYRTTPILYVNGKKVKSELSKQAKPNQTLLSFLREVMKLTGSKLGCAEGGCGACTVMISRYDQATSKVVHYSVNACLMPVLAADGCHITTIEGLGKVGGKDGESKLDGLHPIQKAMVEMHGSQCGFCTPGIIVALYSLFANNPTKDHIEEHLDGNLCRCTGYRPIWDAARSLCIDSEEAMVKGPCGTVCRDCPERDSCEMDCNVTDKKHEEEKKATDYKVSSTCCSSNSVDKILQYNKDARTNTQWLDIPNEMFPAELTKDQLSTPLVVVDKTYHKAGTWIKPTTLSELLVLLKRFSGECKIVVGNTEVGIETKFKHSVYPRLISPSMSISSLFHMTTGESSMRIGSCVPLTQIQHECSNLLSGPTNDFDRIARPIHDMLRWFASTQIRNVACLGGNLATASPISDMNPMLACMKATLTIASCSEDVDDNDHPLEDSSTSNREMNPMVACMRATRTIASCNERVGDKNDLSLGSSVSKREVPVSDFFLAYRKVDLKPYELLETINIPKPQSVFEYVFPFKQAKRREDDISIVTSGMRIMVKPVDECFMIQEVSIAFGGMAPRTVMAKNTAKYLTGKKFCKDTFISGQAVLLEEMDLPDDVPGGQAQFRKALASSFLYKFYLMTTKAVKEDVELIKQKPDKFTEIDAKTLPTVIDIDESEKSALNSFVAQKKPSLQGTQTFPKPKVAVGLEKRHLNHDPLAIQNGNQKKNIVGKPATHASGPFHCTGEALYTDDIPLPPSTLQATLILANSCNVEFLSIDISKALKTPGVVAVYTSKDVVENGGDNTIGFSPAGHDEYVFLPIGEKVEFVGQVLGICIADSLEASETGARSVEIEYGNSFGDPVVSIEDAIEAKSFYDAAIHEMKRSKPITVNSDYETFSVKGSFRCGGQEHFYLETNSTLVIPSESATNLTIYVSTQAVNKTQMFCAAATNTPASKVVVRMKRMGGGFGGKETRSVPTSCAAAIASKLSNQPVRLTLSRDVDMTITGGRHAFLAQYEASAVMEKDSKDVKLSSLKVTLYNNGGGAADLSGPVMDRALFHLDNCYYWPDFHAIGIPCKTSQAPHTAFRGFGGPQGLATCEHIITHLACVMKVSPDQIRRSNMYGSNDATPFGMVMNESSSGSWNVPRMWDKLCDELDISAKRDEVKAFNEKNKLLKRGIAIIPTKFGIAFTAKFMNQGGALVHLYTDGTVLVSTGGTEMGQGLHTKVCQVAAQAFGIPLSDVYVNDTSSDKVANSIPTAASMSTDLYGMATLDACNQILKRIEPIRKEFPNASLNEVASKAFYARIDLSAHGFFALDNSRCGYDWHMEKPADFDDKKPENSWKGNPFNYFTQGVAFAEVEIDVLTGSHKTLRSDVIVDVGSSINPSLDIGQIEGAFIQGMGWCTLEEMIYGDNHHKWIRPKGRTFTTGPGTYKIPAFNDVPEIFNVTLMEDVDNPFAVHSSKAIGEPPFFLGCSVFFALKDAIEAVRSENGFEANFELRMPATSERIRLSCLDSIAKTCIAPNEKEEVDQRNTLEQFQSKGSH